MIKLTKEEAFKLRDEGYSDFVKKSHSKHPTYYLVEEKNDVYKYSSKEGKRVLVRLSALNMLEKYRKSKMITD